MSYGCHVWGPELFVRQLPSMPLDTAADKVHLSFLRAMTGVGIAASNTVLLRDLHRVPVMFHWVLLATRWWNRLRAMSPAAGTVVSCVAYHAWKSDVMLMLEGCRACWSYQLLHTLESLQQISPTQWQNTSPDAVMSLRFDEHKVQEALTRMFHSPWLTGAATHADPRTAPSQGITMCTHARWVYAPPQSCDMYNRSHAPRYLQLCLPFHVLQTLARFRIGWHKLAVHSGRMARPPVPRAQRICRLCCGNDSRQQWRDRIHERVGSHSCVEDLKHFVLECPAYDHIRARYRAIFAAPQGADQYSEATMCAFFDTANQSHVAWALHSMNTYRSVLLGLTPADSIDASLTQPQDYDPQ